MCLLHQRLQKKLYQTYRLSNLKIMELHSGKRYMKTRVTTHISLILEVGQFDSSSCDVDSKNIYGHLNLANFCSYTDFRRLTPD